MAVRATPARATKHVERENLTPKDLCYYMNLDYPIDLVRDDGIYVASHPDLPGCVSMGATPTEAVENLAEVRSLWLEGQLAAGNTIPEPSRVESYSGKFVLRVPKALHRMADQRARYEGVSLNTFITSVLAGALRYPRREASQHQFLWNRVDTLGTPLHGYWWHNDQPWDAGRLQGTKKVRSRSEPRPAWFIGSFAQRIGNHNKTMFKPQIFEDYHGAEEAICVFSR